MNTNSPLLTDFYQLTMAYGYWQMQRAEIPAIFQLTFRKNPFRGNFTVSCGLQNVIEYLNNYQFSESDLKYLKDLKYPDKKPIFNSKFIDYLAHLKFTCDVEAVPEGTLVFPQEPLLRIKGPLLQCQLLETPLINLLNFSSLVATRAAQICHLVKNDPVMEFGLRRAQGPNGAVTASRSAYIGGCESVSNVLAGELYNIPVKGTMAHSWIMSFPDELTSFREFLKTSPITILLVDTYNTLQGVKNAITVGKELKQQNKDLQAVRLDSGDLLELSRKTRKLLDENGFNNTQIIASGDLTYEKIKMLKQKKAPIDIWGVGTKLVTAYEQPSLDAIYKLTALQDSQGKWQNKMKLSDTKSKQTLPGILQTRRYLKDQQFISDIIFDENNPIKVQNNNHFEDLLVNIFKNGKLTYTTPTISQMRENCLKQVKIFMQNYSKKKYSVKIDVGVKRITKLPPA